MIRPYVSRQVWAIVQLQCLTGMRPGEVLTIRSCDLDTTGKLWLYRPASGGSGARSHAVGGIVVSHGQPQVPQKLM